MPPARPEPLDPGCTVAAAAVAPRPGLPVAMALGLAGAYLGSRLPFLPRWVEDHDSVNFARGLELFDLAAHAPHFPGYPVYLAAAWPVHALGASAPVSLAVPGLLAGAVAAVGLTATVARHAGSGAGVVAGLAYAALPGVALADVTPLSDALGLHLGTLAVAGLLDGRRGGRVLAAVLAGLLLGVRLSYLPWGLGIVAAAVLRARGRDRARTVLVTSAAVLAWGVPLVVLAGGPVALWDIGVLFVRGHFMQWGGTAWAADSADSWFALWGWNLGGWLLGAWGIAALAVAPWAGGPRLVAGALAVTAPYALWAAIGQNPEHARHLLPLAPLVALAIALGAAGLWRRGPAWARPLLGTWVAIACLGMVADSAGRLSTRAQVPPTAVRLAQWYATQPPEQSHLLTGSEAGVVRLLAPAHRSGRVRDAADADRVLATAAAQREWVTSSVPGIAGHPAQWSCALSFAGRPGIDRPGTRLDVCARTQPVGTASRITLAEVLP